MRYWQNDQTGKGIDLILDVAADKKQYEDVEAEMKDVTDEADVHLELQKKSCYRAERER